MATEDKAAHKATELKGKAKEAVGDVTDDQDLQAEGQADQAEGNVKQAGDKVKDAGSKVKDALTGDLPRTAVRLAGPVSSWVCQFLAFVDSGCYLMDCGNDEAARVTEGGRH